MIQAWKISLNAAILIFVSMYSGVEYETSFISGAGTHQPLYNTVCYNTILDITQFNNGSQKCLDYIEK